MIYDDDDDDDEVGGEKVHDIYDDNDGFRSTDIQYDVEELIELSNMNF